MYGEHDVLERRCKDKILLPFAQSCPTLCDPMDSSLPGSAVHGIFGQEYWSGLPFPCPGDLPNPGIEPRSPALQTDTLPSEAPGKPYTAKETKNKQKAIYGMRVIFANNVTDRLISKICKQLMQLDLKNQTTQSKNGQKI